MKHKSLLQIRWPAEDAKPIRLAALHQDFPTVGDFSLTRFHAYMNAKKSTEWLSALGIVIEI